MPFFGRRFELRLPPASNRCEEAAAVFCSFRASSMIFSATRMYPFSERCTLSWWVSFCSELLLCRLSCAVSMTLNFFTFFRVKIFRDSEFRCRMCSAIVLACCVMVFLCWVHVICFHTAAAKHILREWETKIFLWSTLKEDERVLCWSIYTY